jgi:hypothetical protein
VPFVHHSRANNDRNHLPKYKKQSPPIPNSQAKERREARSAMQAQSDDNLPEMGTKWNDPMAKPGERTVAGVLRGLDQSASAGELPQWKQLYQVSERNRCCLMETYVAFMSVWKF